MKHTTRATTEAEHPVHQLQQRLMMASTPEARLQAYLRFIPEIVRSSPLEALSFADKGDRVAIEIQDWRARGEILRLRAEAHMALNNSAAALSDLEEALGQVGEADDPTAAVRIVVAIGNARLMLGQPVEALVEYQRALDMCGSEATGTRADALESLGNLYLSTGEYARAIDHLSESAAIREAIEDTAGVGRALCAIGMAFGMIGDLTTAYDYHQQSLEVFRATGDTANQIRALANLASIHHGREELQEALELAWRAYAVCESNGDRATQASLKVTIGDLHMKQRVPDLALRYYLESYELLQEEPDDELLLELCSRIGRYHESIDDLDAAQHVYRHAIETAERTGRRQARADLHRAISRVFERKGFYREALEHYQQYAELQLVLAGEEQRRQMSQAQTKHDMRTMEQELARERERADQAEESVEQKQQELVETHLELIEAENKLKKVLEAAHDNDGVLKEIRKQEAKPKRSSRKGKTSRDRKWEKLRREIEKVHPGFVERLHEACPSLTMAEVMICSLTRLLGDDSNKIAEVMHNGLHTVQTQRYKIRKKLGLGRDVKFPTFIDQL